MNMRTWVIPLAGLLLLTGCGRGIQRQDPNDRPELASSNELPLPEPEEQAQGPQRATVVITDQRGFKVLNRWTPTVMSLANDVGAQSQTYRILISMEGTPGHERQLMARRDGWYIRGTRVFADSIGGLVVDPQNGAMYTISAQDAGSLFAETVARNSGNLATGTYVLLVSDVPARLKPKMTRVL